MGLLPPTLDVRGERPGSHQGPQHQVPPQPQPPQHQEKQQAPDVEPSDLAVIPSNVETRDIENGEVEAHSDKISHNACELCDYTFQTEHGLNVHKGHKHKDMQKTSKKERSTSNQGDITFSLTPSKP